MNKDSRVQVIRTFRSPRERGTGTIVSMIGVEYCRVEWEDGSNTTEWVPQLREVPG